MKRIVPFVATVTLASGASAEFFGFQHSGSLNSNGNVVWDVYATFGSSPHVLLNAFQIEDLGGSLDMLAAIHNDFVGGSWAPWFPTNPDNDSYLLIGGVAGFANSTQADPGWGASGFNQLGIPNGAGWFNSNPPNRQGLAVDGKTQIGRFVFDPTDFGGVRVFHLKVGYNAGLGTPTQFGEGNFIVGPAPGAIALLAFAGLAGRRRRV